MKEILYRFKTRCWGHNLTNAAGIGAPLLAAAQEGTLRRIPSDGDCLLDCEAPKIVQGGPYSVYFA